MCFDVCWVMLGGWTVSNLMKRSVDSLVPASALTGRFAASDTSGLDGKVSIF